MSILRAGLSKTKKLTPASIFSQKNRRRQDNFSPTDEAYLSSMTGVRLGKKIGEGFYADVHDLEGNEDFVVKVPKFFFGDQSTYQLSKKEHKRLVEEKSKNVNGEAEFYRSNDLNNKELFIPTKVVSIPHDKNPKKKCTALIRPKVTYVNKQPKDVVAYNVRNLTDSQLIDLRKKLTKLSAEGFVVLDSLQVGFDKSGRLVIFDAGDIGKFPRGCRETARVNNERWEMFLQRIGKGGQDNIEKYGKITYG